MKYQYNELKEKITAHAGKECADFAAKITTATAGDVLASWYLKQYTTPATLAATPSDKSQAARRLTCTR